MSAAQVGPDDEIEAGPVVLRRHSPADGPQLVVAVNASLTHLAPWMLWAQEPASDVSIGEFLAGSGRDFEAGTDYGYVIAERAPATQAERIVGGCGLHRRLGPGAIEIGYWVHVERVGRGIATAAAVALRDQAYAMAIDCVEIHCDERNTASAAVARRAGFTLIGTRRRPARLPTESDREMIWRSLRPTV